MNIDSKTLTTYCVSGITQHQAQDLLQICLKPGTGETLDADEKETLNNLRQTLLSAGVIAKRGDTNAD